MAELRADGQRVLVTAGASGIGRAMVDALVEAGARVHVCDVAEPALTALRADLPSVGSTLADVSDEAAVDRLFDDVRARLGGLDVLVNNAGIAGPTAADRGHRPRRLAPLHRHRPDRPVPVRTPRRAAAEGRRRRGHGQHVVGRRPLRLRLPHALFRRQVGRDRPDREPGQGARPAQHHRQRDPARHRRRGRASRA